MRQLKHQVNGLEDRTVMSFNRLEAKLDNMKIQLLNSQTQLPSGFIQQEANGAETEYSQTDLASVAQKSTTTLSSLSTVPQSETRPLHKPNSSSSCANIASPSLPEESFLATVYLGSEKFTFDKREVKSPSIYQYSKDIPLLFVEWENSQRLIINNRGIALKFWPEFYQKKNHIGNGHIWNSIKMMWGNWKVSDTYQLSPSYDSPSYDTVIDFNSLLLMRKIISGLKTHSGRGTQMRMERE